LIGLLAALHIHSFLSVTNRTQTSVLVAEGWVDKYTIDAAAREYEQGGYGIVLSTGGPVAGFGGYINDFQTSAGVGADRLKAAGIPGDRVHIVASRVSDRDRTYSSAVALREWFRHRGMVVGKFNVLTQGAHGRRTRLLYEKAFGRDIDIGIISVPIPDYDPNRWWRYSEGVREVFGETIAYIYARFLFWPTQSVPGPELEVRR
jgi:uncharacterized SAM-binding protein YcdF (DUF218 family)